MMASFKPYLSPIEKTILTSSSPIPATGPDQTITVLGERGVWLNKSESDQWRGPIPISQYQVSTDTKFDIIKKRSNTSLNYIQELAVRYLRPPTPPPPGHILIEHQADICPPPAPPIIIRQQPEAKPPQATLIIREAPPKSPPATQIKRITISGKQLPPPPRKLVIERLPPLPDKPRSVLVERWLPYELPRRRVVYNKPPPNPPVQLLQPVRNLIIEWEAPRVTVKKSIKYLGVIRADPKKYLKEFGSNLTNACDLPAIVNEIKTPEGLVLAAECQKRQVYELHGDLEALKLVDLKMYGLGEYQEQLDMIEREVTGWKKRADRSC